jgi:hypothetical protein
MATLTEKLDSRARELDFKLKQMLSVGDYDLKACDDREMLEAASKRIKELEARHG